MSDGACAGVTVDVAGREVLPMQRSRQCAAREGRRHSGVVESGQRGKLARGERGEALLDGVLALEALLDQHPALNFIALSAHITHRRWKKKAMHGAAFSSAHATSGAVSASWRRAAKSSSSKLLFM